MAGLLERWEEKFDESQARLEEMTLDRDECKAEIQRLMDERSGWMLDTSDAIARKLGFETALGLKGKVDDLRSDLREAFAVIKMMKEALVLYDSHLWVGGNRMARDLSKRVRSSDYINRAVDEWDKLTGERDMLFDIVCGPAEESPTEFIELLKAWAQSLANEMPTGCEQLAELLKWLAVKISNYVETMEERDGVHSSED